jgi:hypothetical protein
MRAYKTVGMVRETFCHHIVKGEGYVIDGEDSFL